MISCIREEDLSPPTRNRYLRQIDTNQSYIRKWLSPSAVNNSTWVAIVVSATLQRFLVARLSFSLQDAEMASLVNSPDAFKLYDIAVK